MVKRRERLVVLSHFCAENFFAAQKTFRKEIDINRENCFLALKEIIDTDILQHAISMMTDTTVVNTRRIKGIGARMSQFKNEEYGHHGIVLECLHHSIELYLDDTIIGFDGQTKAPNKLVSKSVFDLISKIKKDKLILYSFQQSSIKPSTLAQNQSKIARRFYYAIHSAAINST